MHLKSGQRITGDAEFYRPTNIAVMGRSETDPIMNYKVVCTEGAASDSYPGNLDSIGVRCEAQGDRFLGSSISRYASRSIAPIILGNARSHLSVPAEYAIWPSVYLHVGG